MQSFPCRLLWAKRCALLVLTHLCYKKYKKHLVERPDGSNLLNADALESSVKNRAYVFFIIQTYYIFPYAEPLLCGTFFYGCFLLVLAFPFPLNFDSSFLIQSFLIQRMPYASSTVSVDFSPGNLSQRLSSIVLDVNCACRIIALDPWALSAFGKLKRQNLPVPLPVAQIRQKSNHYEFAEMAGTHTSHWGDQFWIK